MHLTTTKSTQILPKQQIKSISPSLPSTQTTILSTNLSLTPACTPQKLSQYLMQYPFHSQQITKSSHHK